MVADVLSVKPDDDLNTALRRFTQRNIDELPVLDLAANTDQNSFEVTANNELNGITFYACGSQTTVHHVQSHMGLDDGIDDIGSQSVPPGRGLEPVSPRMAWR